MKNIVKSIVLTGLVFFTSCTRDLEVLNENDPDFLKVYSDGADVKNLAGNLYNTFYFQNEWTLKMLFAVAADNFTSSTPWLNGVQDMSWEPRKAWDNTPSYRHEISTSYPFNEMYKVINTSSLIIKSLDGGVEIGKDGADNDLVRAFARFNMGISYGMIALSFDGAFIVDEKNTLPDPSLGDAKTYKEVASQAIIYLDEAISILSKKSYNIPASWMGSAGDLPSDILSQYANSWAARILSNLPRNSTELASVDWAAVKKYADAGITSDFNILLDGWARWMSYGGFYFIAGLGATDMYVVNKLDPTMPAHWDEDLIHPPASTNPNADKRIETDFTWRASNPSPAALGSYWWSNYTWTRLSLLFATAIGPMPEFMLAENDMYKAEALAYTGNLAGAASIINAGTRTTRGQLPQVPANLTDIIEAIHHERIIEMMYTGTGLQFFEMRKRNLLQKGTPLHFPIPAKTLETLGESFYTHGGENGQDGINGSNGGWR
ncbi:MAG: RagB/SusD family nutrient uptake outer membrane protein [Proteobacteria bacterium]|nr:RagB/SusD family nutrient uptake outer membrane protein [Pseudomonadota bacterium]